MATIHREIDIACGLDAAWRELRDFGSAARLFAGVVSECREEDGLRTVRFASGLVVQERLVSVDEDLHRIAYTVLDGPFTHHGASMQLRRAPRGVVFVWTSDFLPEEIRPGVEALVDAGCEAIRRALEGTAPASGQAATA